jgi:hypothetical protein
MYIYIYIYIYGETKQKQQQINSCNGCAYEAQKELQSMRLALQKMYVTHTTNIPSDLLLQKLRNSLKLPDRGFD